MGDIKSDLIEGIMWDCLRDLVAKAKPCGKCEKRPDGGWEKGDYNIPRLVGFMCPCGRWSSCKIDGKESDHIKAFQNAAYEALAAWNENHGDIEEAEAPAKPLGQVPEKTLQQLSFAPVELEKGGLAFFYSGLIIGGNLADAQISCNNALLPFMQLFYCGYRAKMKPIVDKAGAEKLIETHEYDIVLCLLPRNNLMQHTRPFTLQFSDSGGVWLNAPEAERIDPGSLRKI